MSDVEGFVDDITDNTSDGNEVLTKIYKKIISGVESAKTKNTYNLMLFNTSDT